MVQNLDHDLERIALRDDGVFPNSRLPALVYRRAFPSSADLAQTIERTFAKNGWTNAWHDGIYDYDHYHSTAHEVLGCYEGSVRVQLGGPKGNMLELRVGDALVLPAGVAHRRIDASIDLRILGAYDAGLIYDMNRGEPRERPAADARIANVPMPKKDPVWGTWGPLIEIWRSRVD